jgi:predicted ester cyclase
VAFADLTFEVDDVVAEGDRVVIHNTMSGRHHGPMVDYVGGKISNVFPPTGRRFTSTQTHWFRVADGKVIEHWANRDDMATALQLGWIPPTPRFIVRMLLAKRRERRAERRTGSR